MPQPPMYCPECDAERGIAIPAKCPHVNGYIAFYRGKQMEVYAKTSLKAQEQAAKAFKAKKQYEVTVVLAEKNGEEVVHTPSF